MNRQSVKLKITVFVIAVIALLTACLFLFRGTPVRAEGNNAGNSGSDKLIDIRVDVNGEDAQNNAQGGADDSVDKIASNNELHFKVRHIPVGTVVEKIDEGNMSNYVYVQNSIINGSNSFDVEWSDGSLIKITARKLNSAGGHFSVKLQNAMNADDVKTAYFRVKVDDTFVQLRNSSEAVYVGYELNPAGTKEMLNGTEADSYEDGAHKAIATFNNYSNVTFDLGELLQSRALYRGANKLKTSNDTFWTLSSVSNFTIAEAGFSEVSGIFTKPIISNPTATARIAPSVMGKIVITPSTVSKYAEDKGGADFFAATHDFRIKLSEIGNSAVSYTVMIPVSFIPANPQIRDDVSAAAFRLNVTSDYLRVYNNTSGERSIYKDLTTGEAVDITPDDYRAIVISPKDLVDYACPATYDELVFDHEKTTINGSNRLDEQDGCTVEIEGEGQNYPKQYRITAKKSNLANSNFVLRFEVRYQTVESGLTVKTTIPVELAVETYGGYTIAFAPIKGKKSVSYNTLTSDVFAEMRSRGFMLTEAKSNNQDLMYAHFSNNVLTLDPQVEKINGRATVSVSLTFVNNDRQTITFDSEFVQIDVNAGSLFARFENWQAWLIIAACILGGLILVLFIVWLFIHSISKHRQDELATQAPVSSYIVKLNSTIAATQAQQRMAQTAALSQASSQMLLGAGPTSTASPNPDTLALASGGIPYIPSTPSTPMMSEPQAAVPPEPEENLEELIAKYITDEELLERIFTEKYEPKGMVRRTFFKSKDLQARELDKEKKRIIERYKSPMPMDEAIMSENEIKKAEQSSTPSDSSAPQETEPQPAVEMFVLDFDPDSPLYVEEEKPHDEFSEEKIDIDASPEESRYKSAERRNDILIKELAELKSRIGKVEKELQKAKSLEDELREKIEKAEADDAQYAKDIEDLEFQLASAKNKDKDRITRDIGIKEEKKTRNLGELEKLRAELDALLGNSENLNGISSKLNDIQTQKTAELESVTAELEKAKANYDAYLDRLAKVQARQALEAKIAELTPMLEAVNKSDYELRRLQSENEKQEKERESLKSAVAAAKSQILGATDFDVINELNTQISDTNARLSDLEKETTKTTKRKSDLNIEFNAQRRKANDFVQKNEIPLDDVVNAENAVLGNIELELLKAVREKDKADAEKEVAAAQAVYDDLTASSDDITFIAMEVASNIKAIEEELAAMQAELDAVNAQMENASDDERLMLIVEQGDKSDKVEELKAKLEQENIDGTKRKMEAQSEYDSKLDEARKTLDEANAVFSKACASYDELINNADPLDLIMPGSGIISQDQKKIESENLKKQLERSKNEIEQARLAAEMAQMEAEQARVDAMRASEEARAEAERAAQEAIERAEQARIEAEEKARAEVEAAERARQEAEEAAAAEAEEARRKAQEAEEEAERARQEAENAAAAEAEEQQRKALEDAEEAKRQAMEESEEAKRKAAEDAEEAQRKAMEEVEAAKRQAQEEIEAIKRKAEEEAEAKRLEEENKRKEEEERQKAESEHNEAVAKKVAMRRDQIIAIRNEMKELKGDEDAKHLRERLYNIQLSYDEDERGSKELMDFYNKTMDDIQNSGEIARLKAENAKKPQRVVRKVTERVNRIPKRKPGARPSAGARPAARPGARPAGARSASRPGARPAGARPASRPGARPSGTRPPRPRQ